MAYIGNSPFVSGNFSSTTHSGTGSSLGPFAIGQSPGTKNAVLVFIDGVRQVPTIYGVSGSDVTFTAGNAPPLGTDNVQILVSGEELGVNVPADDSVTTDKLADAINTTIAANTAKVTNATHTGDVTGATALTIAVDAVDIPMLSATGTADATTFLRGDGTWNAPPAGGLTTASQWRLTADFTGDATPIGDSVGTVALVNTDGYASLGSDMTESSGVFAFPSTGYWLVIANFYFTTTTLTQVNGYIDYTANNGGAWSSAAWSGTSNYYGLMSSISINHIMYITDIANQKINFSVDANPSTGTGVVTTQGNASITETGFTFIKLADT